LVEWLASEHGTGATTLALAAAHATLASGRPLVIVDSPERRGGRLHPPGVRITNWRKVVLVRAERAAAEWAIDQALRTSGVGAVLFRMDYDDERRLRRFQLAAARSGALGLVVRRLTKQPEACFADLRFQVSPSFVVTAAVERRVRLQLLRSRQGSPGTEIEVALHESPSSEVTPHEVAHPLPPLSAPAGRRRTGS
jgi:hypothetical protein